MDDVSPEQLARALVELRDWAEGFNLREEDGLTRRLREHLGGEVRDLPVVGRGLEGYQRANFQVAIDRYLAEDGRAAELIGLPMTHGYRIGLAELLKPDRQSPWGMGEGEPGPIEYEPVDIDDERIMCVASGLWLIRAGDEPLLLMLRRSDHGPHEAELGIEIMARDRANAEELLADIERLMNEHSPYTGRILALSSSPWGGIGVEVQRLPAVTRDQIVFPEGVLERIERHTKTFSEHADALLAAGRHLKRGILLHGPPGTGETLDPGSWSRRSRPARVVSISLSTCPCRTTRGEVVCSTSTAEACSSS